MREVAHRFLLSFSYGLGGTLFVTALNDCGNTLGVGSVEGNINKKVWLHLVYFVTAVFLTLRWSVSVYSAEVRETYLQVPLDITEEWDITYRRDYEQEHRASEDEDGEEGRDRESGCNQVVPCEIFLEIIPRRLLIFSRQIDGKQSQGIDDLTRTIRENQTLPTYSRV